ncbi:guanine deaminase [Aspergillus sclerotioniger CBS 115572]|uniref:Probable guanine deaminase n=1 Tax=Aspergillus sclerotioniger CBS 115572 TaxID=1450535 RepID=A0A317WZG9_9EURO|nr:guanine deaminase [Aspergillus sclerotioniger CBS 115572]PWY91769.1 guanine deaminase [Aspergillus sclerotioniger CBS 115572]
MTNRDPEFRHQLGKFRLDPLPISSVSSHPQLPHPHSIPSPQSLPPPPPPLPPQHHHQQQQQQQQPLRQQPQPPQPPHPPLQSSPSHLSPARSKRVSTACDFCRKRKKKCDFRYPNCSACTRAGVRCTIPPPGPQVAAASVPRDQLENLQNRVRWLEEVVRRKTGISVADRPTGTALDSEGDPDWWYQVPAMMMTRGSPAHSTPTTTATAPSSSPAPTSSAVGTELPNVGEIFRDHLEHRRPSIARPVASAPRVIRLASLEEAERVTSQYFDSLGYQYPFLNRVEFFAHLRRIYAGEVPAPEVHHSYHITIATALLIGSADESQAAEFYHVSNETMSLALQNEDLAAVRALLSVAVYTMFATTGPSVWHILGTALRLATSLGLHKPRSVGNVVEEEMAKRAFWSLYNLDRLIASTLGRPLGIADEDISVSLPREFNDDWTEAPGASAMTIPLQVVRLRRIFSRIYRYLFNNQSPPPPTEVAITLSHFRQELDDWRRAAPVYPPALLYSTSYYDYLYATTLLLMYRPSPRNPTPDATSIVSCGDASIQVIRSYWDSYSVGKLKWIWLTLSQVYFAGITILWCLNQNLHSVREGRVAAWKPEDQTMRRAIQAVVVLLEEFGKRRPGVERLAETFRNQSTMIFSHLAYQQEQQQQQQQQQQQIQQQQPLAPPPLPQHQTILEQPPPPQPQHVLVAPPVPLAPVLDDVLLVNGSGTVPMFDPQLAEQLFYSYDCSYQLEILPDTFILISSAGTIESIHPSTSAASIPSLLAEHGYSGSTCTVTTLQPSEFFVPGFIDTHTHAPQWAQRGTGRGIDLLTWLETITFRHEAKLSDPEYAKSLYTSCVRGGLKQGITTACYYGSRHASASVILAETCLSLGQRALIGKCNMNRHAPEWYRDSSVEESLRDTEDFIAEVRELDPAHGLVTPVITPRFAISCEEELLAGLGEVASRNSDLPIQTHFNESRGEVDFTRSLFPEDKSETELYERLGLLNDRSILAHSIYLSDAEIERMAELKCGIAHCPLPNVTMDEFMVAPVREYLRRDIKVGLGTDCGGGYSSSMLDVMKAAFVVSTARCTMTQGRDKPLSVTEGFYLATLGGARVCGLQEKVGNFLVGKEFDALLVRADGEGVMAPVEEEDGIQEVFEKFLMTGDDRNIGRVFVKGREVHRIQ